MVDVKRIDRKELLKKEDKFIFLVKKTLKFITDNKKYAAFAFGFLFIVAIGAYGFNFYLENREEKAFFMLEETKDVYIKTINSKGLKDGYEVIKERFEILFKKFPNSV